MLVHLLRHAEAEDSSPSGRDADRHLTEAGTKRMRVIARAIAKLDPAYDAVLVSPLVRARETAEPVAEACGFKDDFTVTDALLPSASPEELLKELAGLKADSVLVVGHQPHMGRLFGRLVSGRGDVEVPMKKASLAAFDVPEGGPAERAELRYYLPPRVLEKLD
jgi:phosphohistidine phosphatase